MNFNMFSSISHGNALGSKKQSLGKNGCIWDLLHHSRYTSGKSHVEPGGQARRQVAFKDIQSGAKHLVQGRFSILGIPTPDFITRNACRSGGLQKYLLLSEIWYTWSTTGHIPKAFSVFALFLGSQPGTSARNWAEATHTSQKVTLRPQP